MKRNVLSLLLCGLLACSMLTACGGSDSSGNSNSSSDAEINTKVEVSKEDEEEVNESSEVKEDNTEDDAEKVGISVFEELELRKTTLDEVEQFLDERHLNYKIEGSCIKTLVADDFAGHSIYYNLGFTNDTLVSIFAGIFVQTDDEFVQAGKDLDSYFENIAKGEYSDLLKYHICVTGEIDDERIVSSYYVPCYDNNMGMMEDVSKKFDNRNSYFIHKYSFEKDGGDILGVSTPASKGAGLSEFMNLSESDCNDIYDIIGIRPRNAEDAEAMSKPAEDGE